MNAKINIKGSTISNSPINLGGRNTIIQNNGVKADELESILKGIMENLSDLKDEDAESIKDVVDMVREELARPEPKVNRLRNCLTLISPMFTIANGIPTLANNLQGLSDYITSFIKMFD